MIRTRLLMIVPAVAALLSACVGAPYPGRAVYSQPVSVGVRPVPYDGDAAVVDLAPPAPYVEVIPVIPFAGAVWIGGYWGWRGGRHAWVGVRWEPPRAGYGWRPHAWVQQGGRWHLYAGGWVRR